MLTTTLVYDAATKLWQADPSPATRKVLHSVERFLIHILDARQNGRMTDEDARAVLTAAALELDRLRFERGQAP